MTDPGQEREALTEPQRRGLVQVAEERHPFFNIRMDVWVRLVRKGLIAGGAITDLGRETLRHG